MDNASQLLLETISFTNLWFAIVLLVLTVILARGSTVINQRLSQGFPQIRLSIEQATTVAKFLILVCGVVLSILALFGFSKQTVMAIGGSAAIAIGFGLKDIAASVLSGFIILFERPFQVGDRIKFQEIYGDVVSIGLRSIRVRTLDDSYVTIPNSRFITDPISSANSGNLDMMAQFDLYIAPNSDLPKVNKLVREATVASRYTFLEKPVRVLFSDTFLGEHFCTQVRIQAYVIEPRYEKAFESDVTQRLHRAFETNNIQFPTLTVKNLA